MDWQPKFKAQRKNTFFADGRAARLDVEGTVAMGELRDDTHFHAGKVNGAWARTFPAQVPVNETTMARGQTKFGVFCTPCHGQTGEGDGMVAQRATLLAEGTWAPPSNMTEERYRFMPVGEIYNTISHGVRNMPAYGAQIPPEDRWAIVAYVRALQRSRGANLGDLTDQERASLR
jgi:mono/diheme cytochrome c family protein